MKKFLIVLAAGFGLSTAAAAADTAPAPHAAFPPDYRARLAPLAKAHPAWRFEPYFLKDLAWDEVVAKECTPGWNLVYDGAWAPSAFAALGRANYDPYKDPSRKPYDSGHFVQASREAIAYFLDPRNFFTEETVWMFQSLAFDPKSDPTEKAVETALAGSFLHQTNCDGGPETFAARLLALGRRYGVDPVFLAARLKQEQGTGTCQGRGKIGDAVGDPALNGYYNFFNIKACGNGVEAIRRAAYAEATEAETVLKYKGPWTSQARAIEGGVMKIAEKYVSSWRHTPYFQKFSICPEAGERRWSQYMQNISAPLTEARAAYAANKSANTLDQPRTFIIPVYRRMPASPAPDPGKGRTYLSVPPRDL